MALTQAEFEAILADASKRIEGDLEWQEDEDHSPSVMIQANVANAAGVPLVIRGSYNPLARAMTLALIHRAVGRVYALDLGKDHHNPSCQNVGEKHKHKWNEPVRDKEAYVPGDITAGVDDPIQVWKQFCAEANIVHDGELHPPPQQQEELL